MLPYFTVGQEPEPPESHPNFYPEPHKIDAAPQHWCLAIYSTCDIFLSNRVPYSALKAVLFGNKPSSFLKTNTGIKNKQADKVTLKFF
jgi:hypothetical protein